MTPESMMVATAKQAPIDEEEEDLPDLEAESELELETDSELELEAESELELETDSELEWDADSYDGREYESDPEDSKLFSDEEDYKEYRIRKREAFDSKGFVYEPLSGNYPVQDLHDDVTTRAYMTDLANMCVKKFNEDKEMSVELVDIVRVIVNGGGIRKAYITFMAREFPNGPLVEYQAKVVTYAGHAKPPFPILCRPSLTPSIH